MDNKYILSTLDEKTSLYGNFKAKIRILETILMQNIPRSIF